MQISCRDELEMTAGVTLKVLHKQRPSIMIQNLQLVLKMLQKLPYKRLQMQRSLWEKTFSSLRSLNGCKGVFNKTSTSQKTAEVTLPILTNRPCKINGSRM
ncbi:hypothetical protein TNCV_2555721 [Trichonephila clavipes]|nr:hypothetical protein TNCV_2555721 [Trichonephila clavipes]